MQASTEPRTSPPLATLLIADDLPVWRDRVREILMSQPEWQIVGEACDGIEVMQKAAELRPDLVLLDIGMPRMNGIQAAERIREAKPVPKIVFLTQVNDPEVRSAALNGGAEGYVLKAEAATQLAAAIATALGNGHRNPEPATLSAHPR